MKITLWYESHNPHEREAARLVSALCPQARIVDVSTWTAMRTTPSESGWPERHVRAFPCLVLDSDDDQVELERAEETLTKSIIEEKVMLAGRHEEHLEEALSEAEANDNIPGGSRPKALWRLRNFAASELVAPQEVTVKAASTRSRKSKSPRPTKKSSRKKG